MTEVRQLEQEVTLLPCPFCGATDAFIDGARTVAWWVICGTCLSSAADCLTKSAAIEAWNRRTDDPAALLDALEVARADLVDLGRELRELDSGERRHVSTLMDPSTLEVLDDLLRKYGRLS